MAQGRNYVAYIPVPINEGEEEEEGDGEEVTTLLNFFVIRHLNSGNVHPC
jgi:hypothetical protein